MMRRQFFPLKVFSTTNVRHLFKTCIKNHETQIHGNVNQFTENVNIHSGNYEHNTDVQQHEEYIDTSKFQRMMLSVGSSIAALINPQR